MKFSISTQELNYLLSRVLNGVPAKGTLPILSNVLLEAYHGILSITATDLTVGIRCSSEVQIEEEGAITLPAKRFGQLVRELTALNVSVHANENNIAEIQANSSRFRIHGMSAKEFPRLPDLSGAFKVPLQQKDFRELLNRVSFAVSRDDNRFVLTGALLQFSGDKMTLTGTDGKRLARAHLSIASGAEGQYVIPLKAVEEIAKNLSDEGDVFLYILSDKIAVEAGNIRVVTKLLSEEYPDVNRVIPERSEAIVTLHREELMSLLRQVALFTSENSHSVRFTFGAGDLQISANAIEVGEGRVSMPVNYQGPSLEIAFNPSYFLDILRNSREETVTLGLVDAFNPGVITESQSVSPLYVIMPMRLSEV